MMRREIASDESGTPIVDVETRSAYVFLMAREEFTNDPGDGLFLKPSEALELADALRAAAGEVRR